MVNTSTALTPTHTHSARAGINLDYSVVPEFGNTTPEIQARLDEIVSGFDMMNPEMATTFGDHCLSERNRVADAIAKIDPADLFEFIRQPLQAAVDYINPENLQALSLKAQLVMGQGVEIAKRNKGLLAATAVGTLFSAVPAIVAGGGMIAAREAFNSWKKRDEPPSSEQIRAEIRANLAEFQPMVRNLELAQQQIPGKRDDVNRLGQENIAGLLEVALYISAGREILKRVNQQVEQSGETQTRDILSMTAQNLTGQMGVMDASRYQGIQDVTTLTVLSSALFNAKKELERALTSEVGTYRRSLRTQETALSIHSVTGLTRNLRERVQEGTRAAFDLAVRANQDALAGQANSPEALKGYLDNMAHMRETLSTIRASLESVGVVRGQLTAQLEGEIQGLVGEQVEIARLATNQNAPQLKIAG